MQDDHGYSYKEIKQTVYSGVSLPSVTQQEDKLKIPAAWSTSRYHVPSSQPRWTAESADLDTYAGSRGTMSCLLSETILSVNEIKLFVSDKNNKLHSGSEICPLRLDKVRKTKINKVACMGGGELQALPPLYKAPASFPVLHHSKL